MTTQVAPEVQQALNTLDLVYSQRFLDKMAGYGYSPNTDAEKLAMLEVAAQLDSIPEPAPTPQNNFYMLANEKLAGLLQSRGVAPPVVQKQAEYRRHEALSLATDPVFYQAALAIKMAAEQTQQ